MARKFDPVYHSSVIMNLKRDYTARTKGSELTLTDEEIWNLFDEWSGGGATNEEGENAVFEELFYKQTGVYPESH